jgi:phage tail protein X
MHNPKQVDGSETVSTLKAILEAETGIAAAEQLLSLTGKGLADG